MPQNAPTRGERNLRWIEAYCLFPDGPDKGAHVRLTRPEREIVRAIYDNLDPPPGCFNGRARGVMVALASHVRS